MMFSGLRSRPRVCAKWTASHTCMSTRRFHSLTGDAPVHHVDLAQLPDHDVLGLEVAVDDAARVREVDRVAHLHEHAQVPLEQVAVVEALAHRLGVVHEVAPLGPLDAHEQDERRARLVHRDVVHGDDVGVLHVARDPGLLQQLDGVGLGGGLTLEALHGHLAAHGHLVGQQHLAHATLTQQVPHVHAAPAHASRRDGLQQLERALGGLVRQQRRLDGPRGRPLNGVGVDRERPEDVVEGKLRGVAHGVLLHVGSLTRPGEAVILRHPAPG
jgi:hypothetical protein